MVSAKPVNAYETDVAATPEALEGDEVTDEQPTRVGDVPQQNEMAEVASPFALTDPVRVAAVEAKPVTPVVVTVGAAT